MVHYVKSTCVRAPACFNTIMYYNQLTVEVKISKADQLNETNERDFDRSIRIRMTGTGFTRVHILHDACSSMQNGAILLRVLDVKS